jgi:hypothetical protein
MAPKQDATKDGEKEEEDFGPGDPPERIYTNRPTYLKFSDDEVELKEALLPYFAFPFTSVTTPSGGLQCMYHILCLRSPELTRPQCADSMPLR